jgi:transposase
VNVLKGHLRVTIETLAIRGVSRREIAKRIGVDRKTVRRYADQAKSPGVATGSEAVPGQNPPPWPPAPGTSDDQDPPPRPPAPGPPQQTLSACAPHREWIETQVGLGRNAQSIYQDLVDIHGFANRYNSVKRFVRWLKRKEPERFDVLEYPPGEEAQVDFGQGAPTLTRAGTYRRPYLFVMTLKFSGKSFRKAVWKADKETWSRLHEEAWRSFGGVCQYVVLDNLKAGVLHPDIYEPQLNLIYAEMLRHYGVVADPCRVRDPNRKGTVENAIQHTQGTALKGKRFESIEAQNAYLAHWEERWAAQRIHGRKKRQVMELYREEKPFLRPLPAEGFRYFKHGTRTVDDAGLVQVEGVYYAALPARLRSQVQVRIYAAEIEIRDGSGQVLRRHPKGERKGQFVLEEGDRLFNPSRETGRLLQKAESIGPNAAELARTLFARLGRPGQRALYGLTNLPRTYPCAQIEAVCGRFLASGCVSYAAIRRALERQAALTAVPAAGLTQEGPTIRPITEYQSFWEAHSRTNAEETTDAHVPA